jgi:hypothetical protein
MNTYIQPNLLIGFSIFEDDHPNENKLKQVVILHRGGNDDKPLQKPAEIVGDVFDITFKVTSKGWENLCD